MTGDIHGGAVMICTAYGCDDIHDVNVVMIYKPNGLDDIHIAGDVMIYTLKRDGRPLDNGHG